MYTVIAIESIGIKTAYQMTLVQSIRPFCISLPATIKANPLKIRIWGIKISSNIRDE
jgi:hypothetical protein